MRIGNLRLLSRIAACLFIGICICIPGFSWPWDSVEGTVFDSKTGKPMAGVYVLATYNRAGGDLFGHSAHWCVRARGEYTGTDGKFSLPAKGILSSS